MSSRTLTPLRPLLGALLLLCTAPVFAGLLDGKHDDGGFLPVDKAFVPYAEAHDGYINARIEITDGYYLYRDKLDFALIDAGDARLGEALLPASKTKEDPYFGTVEIYEDSVDITLPVDRSLPDNVYLDLTFQGCAEAGLCYPPETRRLPLLTPQVVEYMDPAQSAAVQSEQDRLQGMIESGSFLVVILAFTGLGVLLAFTPCILPTLPILSGLIVGQGEKTTPLRSFVLSLTYALAMALTLALLGLAAGALGGNLQAWTQRPWVIVGLAALVAAMALSMFGLFSLRLPSALETRLSQAGGSRAGSLTGAVIMGMCSTAIVSACAFPAIVAALVVLGERGDRLLGAIAMFCLGIGMGAPLVILGTLGGSILPRVGPWMESVKKIFGFILLATAVWLLGRLVDPIWVMLGWGVLAIGAGATLGALERHDRDATMPQRLGKAGALMLLIYGLILIVGGFRGATDPLRPLHQPHQISSETALAPQVKFTRIKSHDDLRTAIASSDKPLMLDFYADWCTACKEMEHKVFPEAEVASRMAKMTLVQADVTAMDATDRELMQTLQVIGPPTMIFYDQSGDEHKNLRLVGALNAEDFASHLDRFLNK